MENLTSLEKAIFEKIKREYEKPLQEWENEDLDKFLFDSKLISANTIQVYILIIRKLKKVSCEEAGVEYTKIDASYAPKEYINIKKLREKTILSWSEFMFLRNQMILEYEGAYYNFRDVVLLELPAMGLTARQIQYLRTDNVVEVKGEDGNDYIKLIITDEKEKNGKVEIITTGELIITNPDIVRDIKIAKREKIYMKVRENKAKDTVIIDKIAYVESPYLIKGIDNGNSRPNKPVAQPSRILSKQLAKCSHPVLDVYHLSIEDIRRSMIIMMYLEDDRIRVKDVQASLNKKRENDLFWLKGIAQSLKEYSSKEKVDA